ncbi:hypothetical protein Pmani_022291 [Petrolisthes manimaculis]|uniref:Uncharacterized protein n=1 Tax=Petrolisthes manimaculis TaxID=1843537 RepID=A0AAE1PEA9_9EUCA|nr:hypothetical protein Pmani_022291 [Petrolisthes manimaculis]
MPDASYTFPGVTRAGVTSARVTRGGRNLETLMLQ